jgi:hypothetical protein
MMKYEIIFVAWNIPYHGNVSDNYYLDKLGETMLIPHQNGNNCKQLTKQQLQNMYLININGANTVKSQLTLLSCPGWG